MSFLTSIIEMTHEANELFRRETMIIKIESSAGEKL